MPPNKSTPKARDPSLRMALGITISQSSRNNSRAKSKQVARKPRRRRRCRARLAVDANQQTSHVGENSHCEQSFPGWPDQLGLKMSQIFAKCCKSIIGEHETKHPPAPNAHIMLTDFVDAIEKQLRQEYQQLRLNSYNHFQVKFALEPATTAPVIMLKSGFSEPKFFKVFSGWNQLPHLVPVRLFTAGCATLTEIRFDGKWRRFSAFLDTLVTEEQPSYKKLGEYWHHVHEKCRRGFRFMEVPLELRRIIYRFAMFGLETNIRVITAPFSHFPLPGTSQPLLLEVCDHNNGLLESCTRVCNEALEEYYKTANFRLYLPTVLPIFLNVLQSTYAPLVRQIEVYFCLLGHENLTRQVKSGFSKWRELLNNFHKFTQLRNLSLIIEYPGPDKTGAIGETLYQRFKSLAAALDWVKEEYTPLVAHLEGCQLQVVWRDIYF